ncbi:metallophosphoesterase family protein [Sinorhizobium meliloti]|uniref:metallophosphoesterase family protein n=1 Tax=Rhizobium meliloti TaxID=382 RepID=UPI0013E312F0|nr:metallophosphoesterase [Sinorhizobium meliloti]MCO6420253.1 metallophosphoesterase [Sinorhizobium meliloti]
MAHPLDLHRPPHLAPGAAQVSRARRQGLPEPGNRMNVPKIIRMRHDRGRAGTAIGEMIYFTGDTHCGDPRVLRIDRRPFSNMAEHDAALIANWNETVSPQDEVWHLGDFAAKRNGLAEDILSRLNGRKHLIVGNNDPNETIGAGGWHSVQHYAELMVDGRLLVLCHYPFRTWNQMGKKSINLHGHSHGRLKPMPRQFDVGVDARGLRPVSLVDILPQSAR